MFVHLSQEMKTKRKNVESLIPKFVSVLFDGRMISERTIYQQKKSSKIVNLEHTFNTNTIVIGHVEPRMKPFIRRQEVELSEPDQEQGWGWEEQGATVSF